MSPDSEESKPAESSDPAYTAFVRLAWRHHLRVATLLTGDPHLGEELLQDCLVKLYLRWRRVARRGDPQAYLRRMLVNGNVSRWRRARREQLTAQAPDREDPHTSARDPDDRLRRALLALPRQQRAVVVLRYYADLSEADVAAALGCSAGTAKSHHFRAMVRLRELLRPPAGGSAPVGRPETPAGPQVTDSQVTGPRATDPQATGPRATGRAGNRGKDHAVRPQGLTGLDTDLTRK